MHIGLAGLIFATLLPSAIAQDTGSVEGRITSSTTHTAVAGAIITVGSGRASTAASGDFRLNSLAPGEYTASIEAPGFLKRDRVSFHIDSPLAPARLDFELIPESSIAGRVLDEEGHPISGIRVEMTEAIRGTGTTWRQWGAATDGNGRYHLDGLAPGAYLLKAEPNPRLLGGLAGAPSRDRRLAPPKVRKEGERRVWVATYYPSAASRSEASRIVLTGGTQQAEVDIRLQAAGVYAIRGMLFDDSGRPANGTVSLISTELLALPETEVQTHDGVFELPEVPAGDWRLAAELERAGVRLRGTAAVLLSGHDVENVSLRLAPPFELRGMVEPHDKVNSVSVELHPVDAPPAWAVFAKSDQGGLQFPAVYGGHYRINVFASIPGYYLDSILLEGRDVLGKEALLAEGTPPIQVVFQSDSAALRGTVEDCGSATILVLPQDEGLWDFRFIHRASCDRTGHFEIGSLRPGSYYALAVERIDATGLDDLSILRRLAGMAEKVQVDPERASYVELKRSPWPD